VAVLALTAGCAGLDVPDPPVADITQKRQERSEQALREFETKRDLAELESALADWNQGDLAACKETLQRLLKRNPNHEEARLLMAEACRADGDQTTLEAVEPVGAWSVDSTNRSGQSIPASAGPALVVPDPTARPLGPVSTLARRGSPASQPAATAGQRKSLSQHPRGTHGAAGADGHPREASVGEPAGALRLGAASGRPPATPVSGSGTSSKQPTATLRVAAPNATTGRADSVNSAGATETDGVQALLAQGRAALAEGPADEAMVQFRRAAALRPNDPQVLTSAAMAALRADRPEVAVELLRPAAGGGVTPVPGLAWAQLYRILGVAYYRLEDYQSSEVALRQALSLDKSSALSYLLMGCTLSRLGQYESAEAHLRQARTINPRYTAGR
jgi:Flp pilus assembly protein TadD